MKYIRTKDGIYKVLKKPKGNYAFEKTDVVIGFLNDTKHTPIIAEKDDIIKQADTIEELCDEFVVIYNESEKFKKPFTSFYSYTRDVLKEHDLSECNIYGAIWTDKGLIYVAKMNKEGELELL